MKDPRDAPVLVVVSVVDQEETQAEQDDAASDALVEGLDQRGAFLLEGVERDGHRGAHDPYEPREHQIGDGQAIPLRVVEEPVTPTAVVDEYHDHDGEPA